MARKKHSIPSHGKNSTWSNLRYIFYMLFPLLFLAPYFKGLFFDKELVIAHMFTAVAAGLYFYFSNAQFRFSRNMMDYAGLGLVTAYILSSFVALNARDSVGEVFKVLNYFLIYWLIFKLAKTLEDLKKVIITFFISGAGVALIGIGVAFGTFTYIGAFNDGLINSTLQYHNAGAIYMIAAGILGFYLAISMSESWQRILVSGVNHLIFMTAFGAGSRGAMLVTPMVMLIYFWGLPGRAKLKLFYNILAVFIPFALTAKSVLTFGENSVSYHWGMLFLGMILTMSLQYLTEKLETIQLKIKIKKSHILWTGLAILLIFIGLVSLTSLDIMPESKVQRMLDFNLSDKNVQERFYFYKDAFKIIKDHPTLGIGGGGWNEAYKQYQSYNYFSTEVHNHFIQVWVEGGILGFVSFILLWLGCLSSTFRLMRRDTLKEDTKLLIWTAFATALAFGLHSAIDFTLSLGAPMIFMWSMFGIIRSVYEISIEDEGAKYFDTKFQSNVTKYFGLAIVSLLFLGSFSSWISDVYVEKAYTPYESGNLEEAIDYFETAAAFDPLDHTLNYNLAILYNEKANGTGDQNDKVKALGYGAKILKKSKGITENYWLVSELYLTNNQPHKAVEVAEQAIKLSPLVAKDYLALATIYNSAANMYMSMGGQGEAKQLAQKVISIPQIMKEKDAELSAEARVFFNGPKLSEISENLQQQVNNAQNILNK